MTDVFSLLDSISDVDHESLLDEVAELALSEGIDIFGVYCLHTGKLIGRFERDELLFAIMDEPTESQDDLVSALMIRVVASMRPSPALNKPDRLTLRSLATKRPVDIMAYLVNRLNGTRQLLLKRSDESFSPLIGRIATYQRIADLAAAGVDLTPWIHWLLELDSKMNLHDLTPPVLKVAPIYRLLFDQLTPDNHVQLLKDFESWAFEQLAKFDKRDAQLVRESQWARGNAMTGPAYVRSWLENPNLTRKVEVANNKRQAEINKSNRVGRPVSAKTKALNAKVTQILDQFSDILNGEAAPLPAPRKPVTHPALKLNFAALAKHKKES